VDNCGELENVVVLHVQAAVFAKAGAPLPLHQRKRLFTPKFVPECFFLPQSMTSNAKCFAPNFETAAVERHRHASSSSMTVPLNIQQQ
jgi:hypothetical protein